MSVCPLAFGADLVINAFVNTVCNVYVKQKQWAAAINGTVIGINIQLFFCFGLKQSV